MAKILVVEDDPSARRLISFTLEEAGYHVLTATNGSEGLEKAQSELPDLILMDVMMPVMAGFEACLRLKELPTTAQIPILVLTAKSQPSDKTYSLMAGADDYLAKPAAPEEIVNRVKALLKPKKS